MKISLEFKPQDCWVGVFWKTVQEYRLSCVPERRDRSRKATNIWICLIPMLPIHITVSGSWIEKGQPGYDPKWISARST